MCGSGCPCAGAAESAHRGASPASEIAVSSRLAGRSRHVRCCCWRPGRATGWIPHHDTNPLQTAVPQIANDGTPSPIGKGTVRQGDCMECAVIGASAAAPRPHVPCASPDSPPAARCAAIAALNSQSVAAGRVVGENGRTKTGSALPSSNPQAAALTSIFFGEAFADFGNVTVSTPWANAAAIFSRSTLSGSEKARWNAP